MKNRSYHCYTGADFSKTALQQMMKGLQHITLGGFSSNPVVSRTLLNIALPLNKNFRSLKDLIFI